MASPKKERQRKALSEPSHPIIPLKYQHAAAVFFLLLSLVIFFNQIIFNGKTFSTASDNVASKSWNTLVADSKAAGEFPLWNPYIFCGMPAYASLTVGGDRLFDISGTLLGKIAQFFSAILQNETDGWVIFYYFIFGAGIYWLTYSKVGYKIAALVAGLAATFSMFTISWIMIGHNTKIAAIAFFPYIFAILERLGKKFNLLMTSLLVLLIHFSFIPSHVQMIFYTYFALGIYYLFYLVRTIIKKEDWRGIVRSGVIFVFASGIAFSMDADKYLSTIEYNPYSIRGSPPITHSSEQSDDKTVAGGLDYDYATSWSFSPGEMMTLVIPSWYGFGWQSYSGPLSDGRPMRLNTYWGPQPFADAPQYWGIVILALAVLGFVRNRKDPFVQYLGIAILISLFISFGKEFSLLYDLMYRYFPAFNKFRIPSMILVLAQMFVPILAAYGIISLTAQQKSEQSDKRWKYFFIGLGIIFVVALVGQTFLYDVYMGFFPPNEVGKILSRSYGQLPSQAVSDIMKFVFDSVMTDVLVATIVLSIAGAAFFFYQRRSIQFTTLSMILIPAVLFDLWRVDFKPMEVHDVRQSQDYFAPPDYVKFMLQDRTQFRTLEFIDGQPPYSNMLAYWRIQSAYGYHGAKMRSYQDIVDVVGLQNPLLWNLMNVKYIISNKIETNPALDLAFKGTEHTVYRYNAVLPRAFFVNRYQVTDGLDILHKISAMSFDPRDVAFFMKEPNLKIDPPTSGAGMSIEHYGLQNISMKVTATGNNLLFFGDAFYPQGWNAYVDDKPVEIYRLDYHFRGVVVPVGTHMLVMKFEPKGFYLGKKLSLAANVLILGLMVCIGGFMMYKKRTVVPPAEKPTS